MWDKSLDERRREGEGGGGGCGSDRMMLAFSQYFQYRKLSYQCTIVHVLQYCFSKLRIITYYYFAINSNSSHANMYFLTNLTLTCTTDAAVAVVHIIAAHALY